MPYMTQPPCICCTAASWQVSPALSRTWEGPCLELLQAGMPLLMCAAVYTKAGCCCCLQNPVDEKVAVKEIHDVVRQYYEVFNAAFTFYPTGSSADVFHMGLNNFTGMLEDCKVTPLSPPPPSPHPKAPPGQVAEAGWMLFSHGP